MSDLFGLFRNRKRSDPANASDLIASLADRDHEVRKQAVEALAACHYRDPEESRSYEILESAAGPPTDMDPDVLAADVGRFSDFSVAYLRAAYPTGHIEDYLHAHVEILYDGLTKAKTKADILARLSTYYLYSGTSDRLGALDYATAAVLLGDPGEGPGSMVDVMVFLDDAFETVGREKAAELVRAARAHYDLGPKEADWIHSNFVPALAAMDGKEVRWAAKIVEERLRSAKE